MKRLYTLILLLCLAAPTARDADAQYFRYGKNKVHYGEQEWYYLQSEHFRVYYYDEGEYLADFAAHAAEEAFVSLEKLFELELEERIPLIIYRNHGEFAVTNAVNLPVYSDGIGGVTELFKNRIAIPFSGDYRDFRRVVHHELVHAIINEVYYGGSIQSLIQAGAKMRIPLWFNEGLAEYAALGWDTHSDMYVREAILEDDLAPVRSLFGYYAYRGGQSVWDYIAEQYGDEKVAEILRRLRSARSVEQAIDRSIGLNLDELSDRWQRALREIYFPEVTARESLDEVARPVMTREQGFYNTSPALSPLGDQLAYVTSTNGLFDIYLADTDDGEIQKRLIQGQISRDFESLPVLTPGLAWSPDGRELAVAARSGGRDAIVIVNVNSEVQRKVEPPGLQQILSLSWNPDGRRLAMSATDGTQSDIYVFNLDTEQLQNLTDDVFGDFEPSWSPDGETIVFHSDRGADTELRRHTAEETRIFEKTFEQSDLYVWQPGSRFVRRLTYDETWDDRSARFGNDPSLVLFVSDRNGIPNLYEKHLVSGRVRPLTDLDIGVMQVALSTSGDLAAVVSLKEGTPSIYTLRRPFERTQPRDPLMPNVWAQRVDQTDFRVAPALAVAGRARLEGNPFLRDANDGTPYVRGRDRLKPTKPVHLALQGLIDPGMNVDSLRNLLSFDSRESIDLPIDSFARGVTIDFEALKRETGLVPNPEFIAFPGIQTAPILDDDGEYAPQRYKLRFSPDIVYGAAGYDALYGVQGVTQMVFSDMLGNHKMIVSSNLLLDLRNSDYTFSYVYLPRRVDWSFSTFHLSRLLADFTVDNPTYYRYRQYGSYLEASLPFSKFQRLDIRIGLVGVNQADVTDVARPSNSRTLFIPGLTYTKDSTTPGYTHPIDGSRMAVSLSGSPLGFRNGITFGTALFDARTYRSFGKARYTWAMRFSTGFSFGSHKQVFYTSGVQNWLNRNFDDINGFPLEDVTDFVFATAVMPLRGYDINAANGSNFGLINAEFRFPLVAALLPGPIPVIPLYNIQGQVFADVGNIWGGRTSTSLENSSKRKIDDVLIGTGFGIRTLFLGYPVRLDFAWPFDGRTFGDRSTYISVGLDF